jgi:hypothetical protein
LLDMGVPPSLAVQGKPRADAPSIYGSGSDLTSVSRPTVQINPQTGMPYMTTASAKGGAGVGHGYAASGSATYAAPRQPAQANPLPGVRDLGIPQYGVPGSGGGVLTKSGLPPGATVEKTYTAPLVPKPLVSGSAKGSASLGAGGFGSGSLTASMPVEASSSAVIDLAFEPMSEVSGQNMANSSGKPVRTPSGKVYSPTNGATDKVRAPMSPVAPRAAAPARSSGLFGSLFGGGSGGGLFGGMLGGGAPRAQAVAQPTSGPAIYTPSGNVHPGALTDNFGNDMAFMPKAYAADPANSNGGYRR